MTVRRLLLTVLLFAMGAATAAALMAWRQPAAGLAEAAAIVPSKRTAPEPPPIPPPPPLPVGVGSLPSLTFVLETTRSGPDGTHRTSQTITRSHDRVRLALEGGRQEWLFVQNVVYRDRAAAYLVDHDRREIRFHEESSLRSLLRIRGWLDVLTLRFDPTVLTALRDTGERRQMGGATFKRYVSNESGRDGVVEVWWGQALLLPLSLTVRDSGTEVTSIVKGLSHIADATLLANPDVRFPSYKTLDPTDAKDHQ